MAYKVSLTATAEADAYAAFERIREVAPLTRGGFLGGETSKKRRRRFLPPPSGCQIDTFFH
jgi:hypothetical protein